MRRWIPIGLWCVAIGLGLFDVVRIGFSLANAAPITNRFSTTFHTPEITGVRCEWISATFVQGTTVWRLPCESEGSPRPSMLWLNLQQGQADIYTLPEAYSDFVMFGNNSLYGAAFAPDDASENIFFYLDRPTSDVPFEQTIAFTMLNTATGTFTALPQPTDTRLTVRGLDWIANQPEMIAEDTEGTLAAPARFAYVDGNWVTTPVMLPEGCERCLLQVAYREDDAWRMLWMNAPLTDANTSEDAPFLTLTPQDFPLDRVLLSDIDGKLLPLDLPDNRPDESQNEDTNTIQVFSGVFDPAAGNVYRDTQSVIQSLQSDQPASGYRHYFYENGLWQLARVPDSEAFPAEAQAAIQPYTLNYGNPQSIPDTGTPYIYNAWTELAGWSGDVLLTTFGIDDWILTGSTDEASSGRAAFSVQTENGINLRAASSEPTLFPALSERFVISDLQGGYFVGSLLNFTYLHVDAEVNRINPPKVIEHLNRYLRTSSVETTARNAALIVLLGLTLLLLMALVLHRRLDQWVWTVIPLIFVMLVIINEQAFANFLRAL